MGYWRIKRHCRFCGDLYEPLKVDAKLGFCCDWCRVTFHRLCDRVLRKLEVKWSQTYASRNKSRQKREKKS
jgi:hypothetical protein